MSAVANTVRSRLAPAAMYRSAPTCVYIAGSGRNGSTLLGFHLGRHPDVFFAGELTHIWRRGYLNDELCGCGQPFSRCEFWRAVTRAAFGKLSERDARHISRLRDKISSFCGLPSLLAAPPRSADAADSEYSDVYKALLAAISTVSGAHVIVDSSKYPTDLALLLRTRPVPLRVVHLVRDCNAVVFSWKRKRVRPEIHWKYQLMPRYSALKTALAWRLFNSAIQRLSAEMGQFCRLLRYEDLIASFPESLAQIFDWLGYSVIDDVWANDHVAHTVSGNPCRFDIGAREIKLDDEWRTRMNRFDRTAVALLCGRAQRSYGYGIDPTAGQFDERGFVRKVSSAVLCRLSLRERAFFRGAKDDFDAVLRQSAEPSAPHAHLSRQPFRAPREVGQTSQR